LGGCLWLFLVLVYGSFLCLLSVLACGGCLWLFLVLVCGCWLRLFLRIVFVYRLQWLFLAVSGFGRGCSWF
jgi:hypothetical protein